MVRLPQHRDGAHQRGARRHVLELERVEECRRPAPDAGVVLAHILVGIELLRPGQRLGFGDRRAEPLPRHDRDDRVKGVLLASAGGDQGRADAGIETDLVVDGAGIGLKARACRPSALRNIAPTRRSNRLIA